MFSHSHPASFQSPTTPGCHRPCWSGDKAQLCFTAPIHFSTAQPKVIRGCWDLAKYLDRGQGRDEAAGDMVDDAAAVSNIDGGKYESASKMAQAVDSSINDTYFWSFIQLLDSLNSVMTHMSAWCQGCHCHSPSAREVVPGITICNQHWKHVAW